MPAQVGQLVGQHQGGVRGGGACLRHQQHRPQDARRHRAAHRGAGQQTGPAAQRHGGLGVIQRLLPARPCRDRPPHRTPPPKQIGSPLPQRHRGRAGQPHGGQHFQPGQRRRAGTSRPARLWGRGGLCRRAVRRRGKRPGSVRQLLRQDCGRCVVPALVLLRLRQGLRRRGRRPGGGQRHAGGRRCGQCQAQRQHKQHRQGQPQPAQPPRAVPAAQAAGKRQQHQRRASQRDALRRKGKHLIHNGRHKITSRVRDRGRHTAGGKNRPPQHARQGGKPRLPAILAAAAAAVILHP